MSSQQASYYELYRRSSLGMALTDALDELIQSGHINPQLAVKVLLQFDRSASTALSTALKTRCTTKGHLSTYNLCDDVWTFTLKDAVFRLEAGDQVGPVPKVKIVACKASEGQNK